MVLIDIAIAHKYKGKKSSMPATYLLHPYENQQGQHAGKFEIIRNLTINGRRAKRSAHVTLYELAELYAHGRMDAEGIRMRVKPSADNYPDSSIGKSLPRANVRTGSLFEGMVAAVNTALPLSKNTLLELTKLDVAL